MNTMIASSEETMEMRIEQYGSVDKWLAAIAPTLGSQMWSIIDANAFTVNADADEENGVTLVMHKPYDVEGVTVIAACGLVAYSDYFNVYPENFEGNHVDTHRAEWSSGYDGQVACKDCKSKYPNWN